VRTCFLGSPQLFNLNFPPKSAKVNVFRADYTLIWSLAAHFHLPRPIRGFGRPRFDMAKPSEIRFQNVGIDGDGLHGMTRIPDETWENFKGVILEKYQKGTLKAVKREMEEEHGFVATYATL